MIWRRPRWGWEALAGFVLRRPGRVLALSLALLVPPTFALPHLRTSFDLVSELPPSSDAVAGFDALEGSFGPGQVQPVFVIVRSDERIWTDETFRAMDALTVNLRKVPGVAEVRSITRPTGGDVGQQRIEDFAEDAGLGRLMELGENLPAAERGLERAIEGLDRIRAGLEAIHAGVPEQRAGLGEATAAIEEMRAGLSRIRRGVSGIEAGLGRAEGGLRRLARRVAEPALAAVRGAWEDLRQSLAAKLDPQYPDLVRHVGRALALLSGRCPDATGVVVFGQPEECVPGERIRPGYEGLAPALREVADGLGRARDGLVRIDLGLGAVDEGLGRLQQGLAGSAPGLDELESGVGRMIGGLDRIIPGLRQLRGGLAVATSLSEELGLLPEAGEEIALTASLVEAFPELRRELSFFVGDQGRATRLFVTLDQQPYRPRSLQAAREIHDVARLSVRRSPLANADLFVTGAAPFFADVADVTARDLGTVIWAVLIGILLVLVILLRSAVAPLYLVLTVALSFAATLGATVVVFQGILGEAGLVWWLPAFLFVVLVALGADYNVFLTGRIREEAEKTDTRTAVSRGLTATGKVITSAGVILAGTFAALLAAPIRGMVQMGFAATLGLLVDTFVVRSLLVPSIAVLAGSANWWPSARSRRP